MKFKLRFQITQKTHFKTNQNSFGRLGNFSYAPPSKKNSELSRESFSPNNGTLMIYRTREMTRKRASPSQELGLVMRQRATLHTYRHIHDLGIFTRRGRRRLHPPQKLCMTEGRICYFHNFSKSQPPKPIQSHVYLPGSRLSSFIVSCVTKRALVFKKIVDF